MTINETKNGSKLTLAVEGRLDTTTAPKLDKCIAENLEGISELIFDFSNLEYISSAGLRSILSAQKKMNIQGEMVVKNINEVVAEIMEVTGFTDILTIE